MRKPSKNVKREEYELVVRELNLAEEAMTILGTGERRDAVVDLVDDFSGDRYSYSAYRVNWGHGGIIIMHRHCPHQRDDIRAYYLEKFIADVRKRRGATEWCTKEAFAMELLSGAVRIAQEKAVQHAA